LIWSWVFGFWFGIGNGVKPGCLGIKLIEADATLQIEIDDVLRKVCENVLGDKSASEEVLEKRAEAVEIMGLTFQRIALETKVWIRLGYLRVDGDACVW
jgi:hypothetical protein